MSFRGSRCPKHPSQVVVGVCALCLRERLAVLVNVEGLGETDSSLPSPGHSIASEPIRSGNEGIHAVGERVFSARKPFDIKIDGIKSNSVSVRRSMALHNARNAGTDKSDHVFFGSRAPNVASIQGIEKKTLSSLFNIDDAENPTTKARIVGHSDRKANATITNGFKGEHRFNGSSRSLQSERREHGPEKSRRGSFSERAETGNSIFSMPEDDRRFSWFLTLFRRRKKSRRKPIEAFTTVGEQNEWVDARRSWDAPRLSPWEKFGSSNWEIHRSSWEPARPSWDGQTPGEESMFSAIDMLNESSTEVREDTELECAGLQDFMSYMAGEWGNNSVTESGQREGRKFEKDNASRIKQVVPKISEGNVSETKQVLLETPSADEKERARTFLSAKALQLQRDVSTQTSPPRASSGATNQKVFGQLRTPQHHPPNHHHEQPRAPAAWSKVLSKTRWALKHKRKDGSKEQEAMSIGEADDQASTVSGSSFHESARESTTHRPYQIQPGLNKEYGAWNAYCSPMQKSDLNAQQLQQQHKKCVRKGESAGDRSKNSGFPPFNLENGLLRFYLTPVRSTVGSRAKSKQKGYCPWV